MADWCVFVEGQRFVCSDIPGTQAGPRWEDFSWRQEFEAPAEAQILVGEALAMLDEHTAADRRKHVLDKIEIVRLGDWREVTIYSGQSEKARREIRDGFDEAA